MSEGQGGGADGAGPAGEEGAGGRRAGAAGATVSLFFVGFFFPAATDSQRPGLKLLHFIQLRPHAL